MFDEMTDMSVIRPRIERIRAWLEAKNLGALFVVLARGRAQVGSDGPRRLSDGLGEP